MIVSEKWKYVFIGLPFSGSSAISKELVELYDGQPIFRKHANINEFIRTHKNYKDYFIFAVYRDPLEYMLTHYNKFLTNPNNQFDIPSNFIENGGWLTRTARQRYKTVNKLKLNFEDFIKKYHFVPFDSAFSMNKPYLDFIIEFDDMQNSFKKCLECIGIQPIRDLPVLNKSFKAVSNAVISEKLNNKIFGPYLFYNKNPCIKIPFLHKLIYRILQPIRFYRWYQRDKSLRNVAVGDYKDITNFSNSNRSK